jgi:hypothetical protein
MLSCAYVPINLDLVGQAEALLRTVTLLEVDVVMVWDSDTCEALGDALPKEALSKLVRINCTRGAPVEDWIPIENILTPASQPSENLLADAPEANEDDPFIINLVDGNVVRHSNKSVAGMIEKVSGKIGLDSSRRLCNAIEPSHLSAIINMLSFWIRRSRICFPAESFSAGATIQAISEENLTDLVLDSSMTKAVVQH